MPTLPAGRLRVGHRIEPHLIPHHPQEAGPVQHRDPSGVVLALPQCLNGRGTPPSLTAGQLLGTARPVPGAIFGDWPAFQNTGTQLMSDVYYGYSARLMADMARATGRTADGRAYDDLFARVKRAFIAKYLSTENGTLTVRSSLGDPPPTPGDTPTRTEDDTQTALLWGTSSSGRTSTRRAGSPGWRARICRRTARSPANGPSRGGSHASGAWSSWTSRTAPPPTDCPADATS